MILFTHDVGLVGLIKGTYLKSKISIMNFTSSYSGFDDVTALATRVNKIPKPMEMTTRQFMDTPEFDAAYAGAVLHDVKMFEALMKIMLHDFEGEIVALLVQRDEYRDSLMETLIKFLQQRYGRHAWTLSDPEDLVGLEQELALDDLDYSSDGIIRLDDDRMRYLEMVNTGVCAPVINPENVEV